MSFFSRLIKPYEATYSDDEFLEYSLRFIDAYHFADKTYPDTLTNTSRCLYAANYAALFHLIQGRSFTFGDDLCLQVARSFIYASLLAQDLKKPLSLDLLLGSPSQIYTYSTELIMRAWTVSPSHAISLKVFSACKDYITDRPRFQEISGEIITRARIDPDSAMALT
jgi:hypothetical protein